MPNKKLPSNLPACPVEVTLLLLSNKWTILILRDLLSGTKRFGELKKSLSGVSQKVLTANLQPSLTRREGNYRKRSLS